jgi:hypothetical protein
MMHVLVAVMLIFCAPLRADETVAPPPGTKRTFVGFKLTRIDEGSIYETVGLREGDLLKTINGHTVTKPADLMELPAILKRDRKVELKVERGSEHVTLKYAVKTVAMKKRTPASKKKVVSKKPSKSKTAKKPKPKQKKKSKT